MIPNGLSRTDEATLRGILQKADSIHESSRAYLGGRERDALQLLRDDLRTRLNPLSVESFAARADAMFEPLAHFEWMRRALGTMELA